MSFNMYVHKVAATSWCCKIKKIMTKQPKTDVHKSIASYFSFYVVFLIPSLILVGLFFTTFVAPRLWYEWDSLPFFDLFTFPSIHTGHGAHFIASPIVVYATWIFFLMVAFLLPAFFTRKVIKERKAKHLWPINTK